MAADVIVKFLADTTQLQAGLRQVEGAGAKMTGFAKGIVASIGGAALATGIYKSVKAASDLNETISASSAVFGKAAGGINAWASQASSDFGQSKQQALSAATGFGQMFQQLGIGTPIAAKMSKSMVELASDFASFKNVDPSAVLEAQSAAFRGEYDALQKFVPTISAATVETEALKETGKENAKSLTQQEKATATYRLMLDNAGKAMGDFDRTAGGAANKQRQLAAQMADLQATVGQALLPVFTKFLQIISVIGDAFSALPGPVQSVVAVLGIAAAAMGLLWSTGVNVVKAVGTIAGAISNVASKIPGYIAALAGMTAAQAAATVGITLLVAAGALLITHMLSEKSAADKAADAGKKWAQTQVENARAANDAGLALKQLQPTYQAVNAALQDSQAEYDRLSKKQQEQFAQTNSVNAGWTETTARMTDLNTKMAGLQAKHDVLAPAIAKLRREQELAAIAEQQRKADLDALAATSLGVATATDTQRKSVTELANAYLAAQGGELAYQAAQLQVESAQNRVNAAVAQFGPDSLEARQAANDLAQAKLSAAGAAYTLQANEGNLAAVLKADGVAGLQALRASLLQTIATHGDATGATGAQVAKIDELIAKSNAAGDIKKTAKIDADTDDGTRKVKKFDDDANNATRPRKAMIEVEHAGSFVPNAAMSGALVPGSRHTPSLWLLHGGERVVPASRAASGAGTGTINITVNASGLGADAPEIQRSVVEALRAYVRGNGPIDGITR